MIQDFPLGEWLPDQPSYQSQGLMAAENVFSVGAGYQPIPAPLAKSQTVTGEVRGGERFDLPDGTPLLVVGTTTDLFVTRGSVVWPSGLGLSLAAGDFWTFAPFGRSVYAMCRTHGLFRLASILAGTAFVAGTGSPPKAATMDAVGDFLIAGNLVEFAGADEPYRIRWSSFNNPDAAWDADIARQSGYVDMPARFGPVMRVLGGTFDLVFQASGISRIWYTGGPTVFAKEVIEDDRGCAAPRSVVRVGSAAYFLAHDGFCRTTGSGSENLSAGKMWKWFSAHVNQSQLGNVQGAVDWRSRSIVWSYAASGADTINAQVIYSLSTQRWTTAVVSADMLLGGTQIPIDIDTTDPSVVGDDDLDVLGPSFDATEYESQVRVLSCFIGGVLHEFSGPNMAAAFETADLQPHPGRRSFVRSVFPLIDTVGQTVTCSISGRDRIGDPVSYGPPAQQEIHGFCPLVSDARFHRIKLAIPAGEFWDKAQAFQIDYEIGGMA